MPLTSGEGLLREALTHLHDCGGGERECVCWLTGPLAVPGLLDDVLHPRHSASAVGYEIDPGWLNETFISLAHNARELRAQIHSHPGRAYHSPTDDAYPASASPGFLSIVVPAFAAAGDLRGAHFSELTARGGWREIELENALVIT